MDDILGMGIGKNLCLRHASYQASSSKHKRMKDEGAEFYTL
ncbi:hypothetical protein NSP_39530 [Nodularia spumigena CCY9414]|nr:hypothetical protein NSP_39530 [Nodularia spumigena CCY9414]